MELRGRYVTGVGKKPRSDEELALFMDQTGRLRGWKGAPSSGSLYTSFTTAASNFTTESAPGRKMFNVRQHRNVDSLGSLGVSRLRNSSIG